MKIKKMCKRVLLLFCAINICFGQSINSPALDWIQTDGTGAYRFGYATGDEGRHYHVSSATADNTVAGRFGYKDPALGGDLQTTYTAGKRGFRARGPHIARRMDLSQTKPPFSRPDDDGQYHPELDNVFDPNEDRGYDFSYRTPDHIKEEHANRVGDVQGRYSYLDDIGFRHNVEYIAGSKTGFVVTNPVPDTFARARGGPLYYVGKSGGSKVRGFSAVQKNLNGAYRFLASGPDHKRSEISDASGNRRGIYTYLDDKGIQHTVEYIAGPKIGYKVINNKKGVNYNPVLPYFPDSPTIQPLFPSSPSGGGSKPLVPIPTIPPLPAVGEDLFTPSGGEKNEFPTPGVGGSSGFSSGGSGGGSFSSGGSGSGGFPSGSSGGGGFPSGGSGGGGFPSGGSGGGGFPSGSSGGGSFSSGGGGSGVFPSNSGDKGGFSSGVGDGYPSAITGGGKFPTIGGNSEGFSSGKEGSSFSSGLSKPTGSRPSSSEESSSSRPSTLFKPSSVRPSVDSSSNITPFPFKQPEDFSSITSSFPSTTPFPIPAKPQRPLNFGGSDEKWNYDFDYFYNDPSTSNKDWSKPIKGQTPTNIKGNAPSIIPTSSFDLFPDFPPSPFPDPSYLVPNTFGEGLSTAESGNGLKPPYDDQDKRKCDNSTDTNILSGTHNRGKNNRNDQKEQTYRGSGSKSTNEGPARHYYKGYKSLNYPSRGTVKFGGIQKDWQKNKNDDGYFAIPPGVAVRAHVQSLDIVPYDKRYVSPGEALDHHEDKKHSDN